MIPKIIHYCWFGDAPYSDTILACMDSWREYLPDFQWRKWTLEDIQHYSNPFIEEAIRHQKWAFVADYTRFVALNEQGGIYLDTDFLIIKNLTPLLEQSFFIGCQTSQLINCAIIGSSIGHPISKDLIHYYNNQTFEIENLISIPHVITPYFQKKGFREISTPTHLPNATIYPVDYFYAFPFPPKNKSYQDFITENSYGVHLWEGSWLTSKDYFNTGDCKKGLEKLKEENQNQVWKRIYWVNYCKLKNLLRPIYQFIFKKNKA